MKKSASIVFLILALAIKSSAQNQAEPLLIIIIDSSPSVSHYWKEMQRSAQDLIQNAPPQVIVGIVGIDAEAQKSNLFAPSQRADAFNYVQGLKIGGKLTDLARGTDAALALIQQASPSQCVLIYLTDGKLVVPKNFRSQGSFYDLLRREFSPRANVEVVVVNIKAQQGAAEKALPGNVRLLPLRSSGELREAIAQQLTPMIKGKLNAVIEVPEEPIAPKPELSIRPWIKYGVPGLVLLLAAGVGVVAWKKRRIAKTSPVEEATVDNLPPEDALTEEMLLLNQEPGEVESVRVAVLTATDSANRLTGMQRKVLLAGQQAVIGGYKFADLQLSGLKQARSIQLHFDGTKIKVFRLRPSTGEALDDVRLNQAIAPVEFSATDKDVVTLGSFTLSFIIAAESEVPESWLKPDASHSKHPKMNVIATSRRPAPHNMRGQSDDYRDKRI